MRRVETAERLLAELPCAALPKPYAVWATWTSWSASSADGTSCAPKTIEHYDADPDMLCWHSF